MAPATKTWMSRLIKFGVCAGALWYLCGMVTLDDRVRIAETPTQVKVYILVGETADTLTIRDVDGGAPSVVPISSLAKQDQLDKGQRSIERGLRSIIRQADWTWAGWSLLAMGPTVFIMAWRLRFLLAMQKIAISLRDATLLTFAGNFFNFAMPGTTGGDIYKAYHVAKQTKKRAEGITIVLLDRVIGLISFLLLATGTIAVLAAMNKPMIGAYGKWVGGFMAAFMIACAMFFSQRVRRWIRYDRLLQKLPLADKLRRIDETALSFRYHPKETLASLLVTIVNHFLIVTSLYFLARSLGIESHVSLTAADLYLACLLATTVGFLFAAIPISVQGIGLLEAVFYKVMVEGGWSNASQMLALTFGIRLVQIVWSLPGIAVPWLGFARPRELDVEDSPHQDETENTP